MRRTASRTLRNRCVCVQGGEGDWSFFEREICWQEAQERNKQGDTCEDNAAKERGTMNFYLAVLRTLGVENTHIRIDIRI